MLVLALMLVGALVLPTLKLLSLSNDKVPGIVHVEAKETFRNQNQIGYAYDGIVNGATVRFMTSFSGRRWGTFSTAGERRAKRRKHSHNRISWRSPRC